MTVYEPGLKDGEDDKVKSCDGSANVALPDVGSIVKSGEFEDSVNSTMPKSTEGTAGLTKTEKVELLPLPILIEPGLAVIEKSGAGHVF